jgi:hypothetical protein
MGEQITVDSSSAELANADGSGMSTPPTDPAVSYRLRDPQSGLPEDSGFPGSLLFESCRWRSPGIITFDMKWTPLGENTWPAVIPVSLELGTGDTGEGYPIDVILNQPGSFSIDFDYYEAKSVQGDPIERRQWQAGRAAAGGVEWCSASWFAEGDRRNGPVVNLVVDPSPRLSAVSGGLEGVVARIDPTDQSAPLLPLVSLFAHGDLPAIDRLYVLPAKTLRGISVKEEGSCLSIRTDYGDLGRFISQRIGCPHQADVEQDSVLLPDDIWEMRISAPGGTVETFAEQMMAIVSSEVEPFARSRARVDPDSIIDARIANEHDPLEIARLNWSGGKIAVVKGVSGTPCCETYIDPIVITPEEFIPSGIGTDCRDYSEVILSDDGRAFLLFVARSAGLRVGAAVDGSSMTIRLDPALGGREVGLLDLTGVSGPESTDVTVTNSNGDPVPCVQD